MLFCRGHQVRTAGGGARLNQAASVNALGKGMYPHAGSQSYPSPAAPEASTDGSTTVYFSPAQPEGIGRGNWIQTDPKKGFFVILRLYSPLEPFFTKEWRPSEIELVQQGTSSN